MAAIQTMLLLLLMLMSTDDSQAQRVDGHEKDGTCVCPVNASLWMFPVVKYENVQDQVKSCEDTFNTQQDKTNSWSSLLCLIGLPIPTLADMNNKAITRLALSITNYTDHPLYRYFDLMPSSRRYRTLKWKKVRLSRERLPRIQALFQNLTARLVPYQYLHAKGLYSALHLRQLGQELEQLETDISSIHTAKPTSETQKLSVEVGKLRNDVKRMHNSDIINMRSVKGKLRTLKNGVNSCRTIPKDFKTSQCFKGLITNISDPVVTKIGVYQTSYLSGSWGKEADSNSPGEKDNYWLSPLINGNAWSNRLRMYTSYKDLMAETNYRDVSFVPSHTHSNAMEGPSAVLYGNALYYHCYKSADICRYNLTDTKVTRVTLPGTGVGFNNKFPYCYYDCRVYSDIDVEADEMGLWAIYATVGNHGNLVVSQLAWDGETLNVTHTWETQLFKRAVSNAFMSCGVLYATRYVNEYREEVFYAFDTATGKEDNSLALPLEKVASGVASLSYNPTDKRIYMYNDGYLLAYQASKYASATLY